MSEKLFSIPDDVIASEFLIRSKPAEPLMSEACLDYCRMKSRLEDKRFMTHTNRVVGEIIAIAGDKFLSAYSRSDALAFRDRLLARRVTTSTN